VTVPGKFIVLEGGEGSGKSTQTPRLVARLRAAGFDVHQTLEPGGTPLGRQIRSLLLHEDGPVDPIAEALLMAADRAEHVAEVIVPAIVRGTWVVSDRHTPSSLTYQGVGRGLGVDEVAAASAWATGGFEPDAVIVLDVDDAAADARLPAARDRMERAGADFHRDVRAAYRDLAAEYGWIVIDASAEPDAVEAAVWAAVAARFDLPTAP
jgi:dTMP kinase